MFRLENITNQIFFSFQTFFTVFIKLQKCCKKYFLSPTTKSSLNFENNFYSVYKDIKRLKGGGYANGDGLSVDLLSLSLSQKKNK